MLILVMAIFLVSIASVSAADANDTAIASEDTQSIELSQSEEITTTDESQKTIQTNGTEILTASDEETTATQNNPDTLSLEEKTYADLSNAIGSGGDINLQPAYYKYNGESDTITITTPGIINGNGAIIDMAGLTIRAFNVQTSGVTFKNLTIKNANYDGEGGAIYFSQSGSVTNYYLSYQTVLRLMQLTLQMESGGQCIHLMNTLIIRSMHPMLDWIM